MEFLEQIEQLVLEYAKQKWPHIHDILEIKHFSIWHSQFHIGLPYEYIRLKWLPIGYETFDERGILVNPVPIIYSSLFDSFEEYCCTFWHNNPKNDRLCCRILVNYHYIVKYMHLKCDYDLHSIRGVVINVGIYKIPITNDCEPIIPFAILLNAKLADIDRRRHQICAMLRLLPLPIAEEIAENY